MLSMTSRNRSHRRDSFANSGGADRRETARNLSGPAFIGWRDSLPADIVKASGLTSINSQYEFDLSMSSNTRFTVPNCEFPPSIGDLTGTGSNGEFAAEMEFQSKYLEQKSVISFDAALDQLNVSVAKTDFAWEWQQSLSGSLGEPADTISYSSQSTYSAQSASWSLDLPQIGAAVQAPCPTPELFTARSSVSSQFERATQQFSYSLSENGSTVDHAASYTSQKMNIVDGAKPDLRCIDPAKETAEFLPSQENRFTITAESVSNTYQFNLHSDQFNTSIAMSSSQSITSWQSSQPLPPQSDPKMMSPCEKFPSLDLQSVSRMESLSISQRNESRIDLNFQAFSESRLTEFAAPGDFGKQAAGLLQQNLQLGLAAFG